MVIPPLLQPIYLTIGILTISPPYLAPLVRTSFLLQQSHDALQQLGQYFLRSTQP
jgi:hypothetical protein